MEKQHGKTSPPAKHFSASRHKFIPISKGYQNGPDNDAVRSNLEIEDKAVDNLAYVARHIVHVLSLWKSHCQMTKSIKLH